MRVCLYYGFYNSRSMNERSISMGYITYAYLLLVCTCAPFNTPQNCIYCNFSHLAHSIEQSKTKKCWGVEKIKNETNRIETTMHQQLNSKCPILVNLVRVQAETHLDLLSSFALHLVATAYLSTELVSNGHVHYSKDTLNSAQTEFRNNSNRSILYN